MVILLYNKDEGKSSTHFSCKLSVAASGDFITVFFKSSLHLLKSIDCQNNHHQNPNDLYIIFAEIGNLIMKYQEATDSLKNFGKVQMGRTSV